MINKILPASCLAILFLSLSFYTQEKIEIEIVKVELQSESKTVKLSDVVIFTLKVTNESTRTLYVALKERPVSQYFLKDKMINLGLDLEPENEHVLEFAQIREIRPKSKTEFSLSIPVSSWTLVNEGKWNVYTTIGILEEKVLKRKLRDLDLSLEDNIKVPVMDFFKLQKVHHSNDLQIEIIK